MAKATVVVLFALAFLASCAAERRAIYSAPDLAQRGIGSIQVAAIADERPFPGAQLAIGSQVGHALVQALSARGYRTVSLGRAAAPAVDAVIDASAAELLAAAPAGERYLLFVSVEQIRFELDEIGSDARVRLAAVLVDAEAREVVWRDRAEQESSIAGAGLARTSLSVPRYEAIYRTAVSLVSSLPQAGP